MAQLNHEKKNLLLYPDISIEFKNGLFHNKFHFWTWAINRI
jgi:hypothetical protein